MKLNEQDERKVSEELQKTLKGQLEAQREAHHSQVSKLRDEVEEKMRIIEALNEYVGFFKLKKNYFEICFYKIWAVRFWY